MDKLERANWINRLSEWSDPEAFSKLVSDCKEALGPFGAMIEHGTGFWRDAWLANQHAFYSDADAVRLLHPDPHPDYALRIGGIELKFEATEAMMAGRRRGDEFRDDLKKIEQGGSASRPDPPEEWLTPCRAFELLKQRAVDKAKKPYAADCGLLIYLNESDYNSNTSAIVATFQEATAEAGKRFQSVQVLWSSSLYRIWHGGEEVKH